ncbi:metallophosphoesterase [Tenuibacillus multivorans]|uniref:Calcineurin-like phosphoesterase domain-containing protein n=1 Tax=Tenuibacillus multivorans TaxID=237069 RepID=A0A1G9YCS8_9BACI|nr:metallophosphoesterase [Tenuibacillus multivorans]GEL76049.1 metallophosphoesterase [Tenuibacillus multivorans]SDN06938.1 hypothetical protein SAMN05216498_1345 [Tenuibacillus multivorans]
MSKKVTRRSFLKRMTFGTLGLIGLSYGGYYYAHEIEPKWLKIINSPISSNRIPEPFNGFKILQFTDTHIGFHYSLKDFEKLIQYINKQSADLVVFTGDLTDDPSNITSLEYDKIIELLSLIDAPYGKYWIFGNHDHGGYGTSMIQTVMKQGGFSLLQNSSVKIPKDNAEFTLSGTDDVLLGSPNLSNLIQDGEEDLFNVLLCHEPDYAEEAMKYPFDVQLSGHSHGGQIQLPFIGYIVTPQLGTEYVEGSYTLGQNPLQLFVSRGIGTTRLPFRFFCRPEINVYTLKANTSSS